MCSPKSHVGRHSQTCPVFLVLRQLARVLVAQVSGWRLALGRSCWQGQLIKRCPACCDKPSIYSFGFWMFIKCPMFANEQCNKAPWDLLGSPIVMLIIPLTFLMMVPLLHESSLPAKIGRHMRHHRAVPGARPYISCLGRSKDANNIWDSKLFNPQNRYG